MNKLETIGKQHYNELSETDLYILGYICHHKKEVRNMSIYEVAKCCNISHTSIMRFCQKLNFDGFSELKLHLKYELKDVQTIDDSILDQYANDYQRIAKLMKNMDTQMIMELLDQAARCFVYYTNELEQHAALELKRHFLHSQKVMHLVGKKEELNALLSNVNDQDIFIIFSSSAMDEETVHLHKTLQGLQINALCILPDQPQNNDHTTKYKILYPTSDYGNALGNSANLFILIELFYIKYLLYKQMIHE